MVCWKHVRNLKAAVESVRSKGTNKTMITKICDTTILSLDLTQEPKSFTIFFFNI